MSIIDDIYLLLHQWVTTTTCLAGNKVIRYAQNTPQPVGLCVVINPVISVAALGILDETSYVGTGVRGSYSTKGHRESIASIHAYGEGALNALTLLQMSRYSQANRMLFRDEKITLVECTQVRNLTGMKGDRFEERGQMDVRLRFAQRFTENVDYVRQIKYEIDAGIDELTDAVPPELED